MDGRSRVARSWNGRVTRRRTLAGMGAAGAAALFAAACSGGSSGGDGKVSEAELPKERGQDLLNKPEDSSAQAQMGGVYQAFEASEIQGLDPIGQSRAQVVASYTYPRLLKKKPSFDGVARNEATGDLAESWEFAGDGLQLTLKLRPNAIWDRRAPTSGRTVDSQDVKWSADRFLAKSSYAVNYFNAKSPAAPITSIETPDARTVVLKLAFPYVPLLATLSRNLNLWILPREADGGFNPQTDVRGAGPWILEKYTPSVGLEYKRNPDWYEKGRPFLDGWSTPIVPEYATRLAQFRSGQIWSGVAKQEDVLQLKKDFPRLNMNQGDYGTDTPLIFFGFKGIFKDPRLRQAVSLLIDRELIAETLSDSKKFEAAGLPKATRLNSFIGAGWQEWLDPAGNDFGQNGALMKYNPAEAKKLVQAAGITGKPEVKFYFPPDGYGAVYQQTVPIVAEMINAAGLFDVKLTPVNYQNEYLPKIHFGGDHVGAWDGAALTPAAQGDDPGHQLQVQFHSKGAATRQPPNEDPRLDAMIEAQLRETDSRKRVDMIRDIQRYMPTTMIGVPVFYQAAGFGVSWPWARNVGAVRTAVGGAAPPTEVYPYLWYDKAEYERSKP